MKRSENVFLTWGKYQSRSETMKEYFDYEVKYFNTDRGNLILKYLLYSVQTLLFLMKKKPKTIWVQLPPSPLMHIVRIYSTFSNSKIIYDCHNAIFRRPWVETPLTKFLLKKGSNRVIVHNEDVKSEYGQLIPDDALVLLDKPFTNEPVESLDGINTLKKFNLIKNKYVILPASFNSDEPIEEILGLDNKLDSSYKLVVTGNYKKKIKDTSQYESIVFTGWITSDEYKELFTNAVLVLGLTKIDFIQLSAANEGLIYKVPMVLSDTETLRNLFPKGSMFTDNSPESIAYNVNSMIKNISKYKAEIQSLSYQKEREWKEQANLIKQAILGGERSV
jgi:hypothetical protein